MKKTIHLHIGTHKTGTTSIQKFLYHNFKALHDFGYDYLPNNCVWNAHHPLGWAVAGAGLANKALCPWIGVGIINHLEYEIEKSLCDNIIISSENLYQIKDLEFMSRFFKRFKEYDFKIISIFREQSSFLESWYYELTRADYCKLDEDFEYFITNPRYNADYYSGLIEWEKFVERENIYALDFQELTKDGGLIENFLELLGIKDFSSFSLPEKTNEKMNYSQLILMRAINRMELPDNKWKTARDIILSDKHVIDIDHVELLTDEKKDLITSIYMDSNKKLCQEFGLCFKEKF